MSSTSGEFDDRSDPADRSRSTDVSRLRGLALPHPTSPADTNHTEMIDIRPVSEAYTQAIPRTAAPSEDSAQTEVIRRNRPSVPESHAAPPNPHDVRPASPARQEWAPPNSAPPRAPGPAATTEPIRQLNLPPQGAPAADAATEAIALSPEVAHSAMDGRTDHHGLADYDGRTNPIPQQTVSPPRPRPPEKPAPRVESASKTGAQPPRSADTHQHPGGSPNPVPSQQLPNQAAPQPEQSWQLGSAEHAAPHPGSPRKPDATPPADSAKKSTKAPSPVSDTKPGRSDRPLSPRERRTWLYAGIGAATVVAVGIGVTLFAFGGNSGTSAASGGSPSVVSALTTDKAATAPSTPAAPVMTAPATVAAVAPLIPGYQVIQVPSRGAAFDVPKQWQIDPAGTAVWGTAPNTIEIAGLVQDGKGYCPNYVRTNTFLTMSAQADPAAAAKDIGTRVAKIGWTTSTGATAGAAEQLASLDGQLHGAFVETDGTFPPPAPGCAGSYAVYTYAFPSENGNFVMTIAADTGVAKGIDKATAQRILASIRPLPEK